MTTGQTKQSTISVGGMACSGCADAVQDSLNHLKGVKSASVDLNNETASVSYDTKAASAGDFEKAIEETGYEFRGIKN